MKKLLLVFVGLLCSLVISAQTNFQELSLEKAREQARAENKPIFLDCYTSWCGPCKMMANDVFTLEAAGNYSCGLRRSLLLDLCGRGPHAIHSG